MANNRATGVHTSLYPENIDIIKKHREQQQFNSDAAALQDIITFFGKNYEKTTMKNFLVFIGYPMIINLVLWGISRILYGLSSDMMEQGIPFQALHELASTVNLIAIAVFMFLAASIFLFIKQTRQQKTG